MQLYPTRATFHVALAGTTLLALGVATRTAAMIGFGGAMILTVGLGRAVAMLSVTRLRAAGFEMVWNASKRFQRVSRGTETVLWAELRNRGVEHAQGVRVRAIASSLLDVRVEPSVIDLPRGSKAYLQLFIRGQRVGRWGLHGLALEVRGTPFGGEGLYEVPLMFANPFGIEVWPEPLDAFVSRARGGRSRHGSEAGRPAPLPGGGTELRELREAQPGDPFKRIAWKASARRGKLLVREMEKDDRDTVWFVVETSVELWAGPPGRAPLDTMLDRIAALMVRHLRAGDLVGLVVLAARVRTWIDPEGGANHASKLGAALASASSVVDADRSDVDEVALAERVAEHLRPLDGKGLADIRRGDLDSLAVRAEAMRSRAPFSPRSPIARSYKERVFRHYLASFGVELPPRVEGEHAVAEQTLATTFAKLIEQRRPPSLVHVCALSPARTGPVPAALRRLRARRVEVRWTLPRMEESIDLGVTASERSIRAVIEAAVRTRAHALRVRGERMLRRLGARPLEPRVLDRRIRP